MILVEICLWQKQNTDQSCWRKGKGNDNGWVDPASEDRHIENPQAAGVSGSGVAVKATMT